MQARGGVRRAAAARLQEGVSSLSPWLFMSLLAVVQGLAEFLPISSSGHLALIQWFAHVGDASITEDVVLHAGTLVAVAFYYRSSLAALLSGMFGDVEGARRYALCLIVGNIPAGIVGIGLKDQIESLFAEPIAIIAALAVTGAMLWRSRGVRGGVEQLEGFEPIPLGHALLIGLAQAFAILPGASRSGWTLVTGLRLGLAPAAAARFSFLLSMPAIAGATLLSLGDMGESEVGGGALLWGFVLSAAVGYWSLRWLVRLARGGSLHRFAPYLWALCLVAGALVWLRG